ncbi:MAG: LTA synthase family protein [Prevotella sp.]|nr:LTA synthase family protein [Prevotella sp.]MCM1074548.1 LTA synthase family protein [Ruminococcus sp.]
MKRKIRQVINWFCRWDVGTAIFAGAVFASLMAFNVVWCMWTTFTPFSHFPLYISTILVTLILTLPYAMWRCKYVQLLILIALQVLLLANLMYSRTYFNVIPLTSYTNAGNLSDFMPSVWASLRWSDLVFLLITVATVWLLYRYRKPIASERTSRPAYAAALAIPLLITLIVFPTPGRFKDKCYEISNGAYSYRSIPVMYTVFGNLIYQTINELEQLSPCDIKETEDYLAAIPRIESLPEGVSEPENLIFIFCESLESWVIDMKYDGQEVTPNLNALLRKKGTFYDPHVVSQARDGRSIDGQLLCLTGLYPLTQGAYAVRYPDHEYPSLHKALKQDRGARAVLLTGDKEYVWNQGVIGRSFGLDTIVSFNDFRIDESYSGRKHIVDTELMRQSIDKINKGDLWPADRPYYLQIVTYSGHTPFKLPDNEKKLKIKSDIPSVMADYMQVAHFTDEALGIMISYLRTRPDWDKTMVVITGDHEGLADHRQECLAAEQGRKYVSAEQYVPFIVLNSPISGRTDKVMGQVDIFSSLLYLLGLNNYEWTGLGRSIFSANHPGGAISTLGERICTPGAVIREEQWKTLSDGMRHSDRILRYDLLRKE